MAERGDSVVVEAPQESTLLDSAIPAEQTKYLPDIQEPELAHPEPGHPLAHINPLWHANAPAQVQLPEQQITSEPEIPLGQTKRLEENHLSGPLAAFEQPTFPEIAKSLEHAPPVGQAKPEEPLASVGNADLPESTDVSAQNGDTAQLIGMEKPGSFHSAVQAQSDDKLATTAALMNEAVSSEPVDTTKEQSSADMSVPMEMPGSEPNGASEHTHPSDVPTTSDAVPHGDNMDTSEEAHHPAQAGMWDQTALEDDEEIVGRTLDVDVGTLSLRLIHMAKRLL